MNTAEKLDEIRSLRKRDRHEEAIEAAKYIISMESRNTDAWWNLALAQHSLNRIDDSLPSLKKVISLDPRHAPAWSLIGVILAANGEPQHGLKAITNALQIDPNLTFAVRKAVSICRDLKDLDGEIHYIKRLDAMGQADGHDLNRLGIAYWEKKHFSKAIDYYRRSAAELKSCAPYFNLALVYNHNEVSQDADAIDCLERALSINPEYDRATKRLEIIRPRLKKLADDVLSDGESCLSKEDWYQFYLNPFELLGADRDEELEDYDTKRIQKLKKRLLQEIELEDGKIDYLEGLTIDKSRAIGICEELNDEIVKEYHWLVFSEPYLLGFLTRGEIRHFLCLDDYNPIDLLNELDSEWSGFREWLSQPFARQYDLVLTRALQKKRVSRIESLFDGRRWILREHEDRCFEGARRQVEQLLVPLRQAAERAKEVKPTASQMNVTFNQSGLISIINLLSEPFRDQQSQAVSLIRDIAITTYNEHGDTDLSKEILTFSRKFSFKSAALTQRLESDFNQIEKLIAHERQHEAKLTLGKGKMEVTKDGVRQGATYIAADNVTGIRWGVFITDRGYRQIYEFLMVCRDNAGLETKFSWKSYGKHEEQQKHFSALVKAALSYIVPKIYEKIRAQIGAGRVVEIGPCSITKNALMFEKSGWFSSKQMTIPWSRVETCMSNGVLSVYDRESPKTRVEMEISDTDNAVILQFLASIQK